jgi:hypothetical protein
MKNDVFIARLAHGAMVTAMATCMTPQCHTMATAAPTAELETAFNDHAIMPDEGTQQGAEKAVVTLSQAPAEWDTKMERSFRKLALEEAKGTLNASQASQLEELERWRNRLLNSQSSEEILIQIKRDRLLERMESLLREYVQFQETTGQKRATT